MDEEALQRLREQSGLRLDAEGQLWHGPDRLEHARTVQALHLGIHRAPDGRWATRIGREWAYLAVDDTAFFVRAIDVDDTRALLVCTLSTGELEQADPATLRSGANDALTLRLSGDHLARTAGERARLTRAAQLSLSERIVPGGPGFCLRVGERSFAIGPDDGPELVRPG